MSDRNRNDSCSPSLERTNHIKCNVANCTHHEANDCCNAECIHVGPAYAVSEQDTACATFKAK